MKVQQALRVEEYGADDAEAVEASRLILRAHDAVAMPWMPELTSYRRTMQVRHSWDTSPERHFLARVDGRPVAMADVELGRWDNTDLAWVYLVVDRAQRRRGHGSAFLVQLLDVLRGAGCTKVVASGWDEPGTGAFAARHGFTLGQHEVVRVVFPQELPPGTVEAAYAEAEQHAADYELVRVEGQAPDVLLPALSALTAAINDAPNDDLDIEEEAFPVERVRAYEQSTIDSGHRLRRVLARHRETGEPAGHTVVAVDAETPRAAHQHDTSVVRGHRGHRLGLLLKADMMRWLAETEPQVTSIDTWNAESNGHMIAVNERLGYRVMGRELDFQRPL